MSFITHVFEPSLTFFPANVCGEEEKEAAGAGRDESEGSEADICAQLVSPLALCLLCSLAERVYATAKKSERIAGLLFSSYWAAPSEGLYTVYHLIN